MSDYPRSGDLELIPIAFDGDGLRGRFVIERRICRPDGALYGGCAIAASITAMEVATQSPILWATTQFVASPRQGTTIELETTIHAAGKRIKQVHVNGLDENGAVMFSTMASTAIPRENGIVGQFQTMPNVAAPDEADAFLFGPPGMNIEIDFFASLLEHRSVSLLHEEERAKGAMAMWARLATKQPPTPAGIAFMADMAPISIASGLGKRGGGISLDNSMRFGPACETEWVLLEVHGNLAVGGYGHCSIHVWSQDGVLVGYGGQTSNVLHIFDEGIAPPNWPPKPNA
ncbi:MAG TPA: thioesterase family protein [Acidimicrobiales bacterium]|nr:thioesterase family protein [Acidimicrobiales bacterium]